MGSNATVRRLGPADVFPYRATQAVYADAFDDLESYLSRPPSDAYVARWLGSAAHVLLVAEIDGEVVAGLTAYVLDKAEQERAEIYLYDLAVHERHRRRGIATALIRELQRLGAEVGAWVIFVQADHGDEPAIALYESLGTREEVLHFDVPVARRP
jgi:aminoglycoside 3-N-acetyltransferase I